MSILASIWKMSVNEYCNYLESSALHLGISPFDLNMEYHFEIGIVDTDRYERAKAELLDRRKNGDLLCDY